MTVPTHVSGHTLDWIVLPKGGNFVESFDVGKPKVYSDHSLILIDLKLQKPLKEKKKVTNRKIKDIIISDFKADIQSSFDTTTDQIDADSFNAPMKTKEVIERPFSQWYNLEIKAAKTEKRRKERVWKKSGLTVHKEIYISACRHVNKLIEQAKKTFFKNKFNCVKSCKELFTTVNYLFGKKVSSPLPNVSDTENASQFSKFFIDKIDTIRLNLDNTPCSLPDFTTFTDCQLISFDLTNETEIKKLILDSPTKHCDLDPLPTNLLKQCISDLLPAIVSIINESLQAGVVPICFKNACQTSFEETRT